MADALLRALDGLGPAARTAAPGAGGGGAGPDRLGGPAALRALDVADALLRALDGLGPAART
ncbi:hypothetical protein, partial [Streptomyces griseus]|uniref:hypothetical protein n=1 Tax=Streptomyces griseus TaxID=1911 RepID=UPI0004CA7E8F